MGIDFGDYLRAKVPLDERSLNQEVRAALIHSLAGCLEIRCLDLGTGTGAMLRRLIEWELAGRLVLTGLDQQAGLLEQGSEILESLLRGRGFTQVAGKSHWRAPRADQAVDLHLQCSTLANFHPAAGSYGLVTAHAFLDLVPLQGTLERIKEWLEPDGFLYATLNYDGGTYLFPAYEDEVFEVQVIARYDESMEQRRVDGQPSGGHRAGSRLHAALLRAGFELLGYGSSDWNLTPLVGTYRDEDAVCLQAILECIRAEAAADSCIDQSALETWFAGRLEQLRAGQLGLIVHQLDLLARLPGSVSERDTS